MNVIELHYSNTNTYLIKGGKGYLLFDTGWAGTFPDFCRSLGKSGVKLTDIAMILISHYHPDHMGIAQEIADSGPGIVACDFQKDYIHNADVVFEKEHRRDYILNMVIYHLLLKLYFFSHRNPKSAGNEYVAC